MKRIPLRFGMSDSLGPKAKNIVGQSARLWWAGLHSILAGAHWSWHPSGMRVFLIVIGEVVPVLVLVGLVFVERWKRDKSGERPPIREKLLREPGHTLRRQFAAGNETFLGWFFGAMGAGCFFGFLLFSEPPGYESMCLAVALAAAVCTLMGWRTLKGLRPLRLGILGEQAVAEQLQSLIARGYQIFHDVPGSGKWNIDHVAVGPAGVFAIETKARSKKPGRKKQQEHEVIYDGKTLRFPWGEDNATLEQARRNGRWLAEELSKATGERVAVQPMVVLPGWYVTMTTRSDLKVLNAKVVPEIIANEEPVISSESVQRIAYQLDRRCRDVEL